MRNMADSVADSIENFILDELMKQAEAMVQRNELAQTLNCAPSQISYVLNTRFTPERGFVVESRRGAGGFVRIMKQESDPNPTSLELLKLLHLRGRVSGREARLLDYVLRSMEGSEAAKQRFLENAVKAMEGR
ncbi:MAG: CtsR family transcriptional regulator [Acidaminococcaceae bacterium]|nr:CtsR family transcriptional regulator [Acidaminococcaceae bacterium]